MADAIAYTVKLIDAVTGPARVMTAALKGLQGGLDAVAKDTTVKLARAAAEPARATARASGGAGATGAMKANAEAMMRTNDALLESFQPIKLAEGELDRLKVQLRNDKLAVTNLTASLRQLGQANTVDIGTYRLLMAQLQHHRENLAKTQQRLVLSGNAAKFGSEGTNRLTTTLRQLAEAAGGSGITGLADRLKGVAGPLAQVTGLSSGAAMGIAALGVAAVGAVVGIVALAGGLLALTFAGAKLALAASEAKQDTLDMLEAMLGSEKAAKGTYGAILGITKVSAASKEQVTQAAQELAAAGVTSQRQLVDAVKSVAQVESVLRGGGGKVQAIIEKAAASGKFQIEARRLAGTGVQLTALYTELSARTGKGVKEVEAQLKAGKISAEVGISALMSVIDKKFGGVAAKQAMDFGVQMQRLKDNIGALFADVNTEPFLKAMGELVDIFDASTVSGSAMKELLTGAFDSVFKIIAAGAPYVKTFLKGLIIIALNIAIALKPVVSRLREAFGGDAKSGPASLAETMNLVGKAAGVIVGFFAQVATYEPMWKALEATIRSIGGIFSGFSTGGIVGATGAAGSAVVSGLVAGITSAAGALYKTVTNMAQGAIARLKSAFQMHSPSRVMMGMGVNLSLGLAQGIKAGAPVANDNMQRAVSPPRPTYRQSPTAAASRGHSVVLQAGAVTIQVSGSNAQDIADQLGPLMADVFERAALTQGTAA